MTEGECSNLKQLNRSHSARKDENKKGENEEEKDVIMESPVLYKPMVKLVFPDS
jgi:hypothetical protein